MFFRPWPGDEASDEQKDAWATAELRDMLYMLELESWGFLHSYAGLIGKVPLCHDWTDY